MEEEIIYSKRMQAELYGEMGFEERIQFTYWMEMGWWLMTSALWVE